jgi:hypothetical protein
MKKQAQSIKGSEAANKIYHTKCQNPNKPYWLLCEFAPYHIFEFFFLHLYKFLMMILKMKEFLCLHIAQSTKKMISM